MTRQWVVNASPIITLSKIDRVEILPRLCDELIIPRGVVDEIRYGPADDPAIKWIMGSGQAYIQDSFPIDQRIANWDLGLGESQVLSWLTSNRNHEGILDDRAARKAASILRLPIRGTIGIIALAQKEGHLQSALDEYEKLRDVGFRISPSVIERVVQLLKDGEETA